MTHELEKHYRDNRDKLLKKINRVAFGRLEAEDVLQEGFLKAHTKFHLYDSAKGALAPWFHSVMMNVVWEQLRKAKKQPNFEVLLDISPSSADTSEILKELSELIETQSNPLHKDVLRRLLIHGHSNKEISRALSVREDYLRKILQTFRDNCKCQFLTSKGTA